MISPSEQAKSNICDVFERFDIKLKPSGSEFKCLCPFHKEETPSMTITPDKGLFFCFGCGAAGSSIDFVMRMNNMDAKDAIHYINKVVPFKTKEAPLKELLSFIMPIPVDAGMPDHTMRIKIGGKFEECKASVIWDYRDIDGNLLFYVRRFDTIEGKTICPLSYAEGKGWVSKWVPPLRPLYGLEFLKKNPDATILLVEGEKTADAARLIFPEFIVMTWPGGANAIKNVDWHPILGRKSVLWPDADEPGINAMLAIYKKLGKKNCLGIVQLPSDLPVGWDLADSEFAGFDPHLAIKNIRSTEEVVLDSSDSHFTILGYEDSTIYAYHHIRGKIDSFRRSELSINCFASLAPIDWWRDKFPNEKGGISRDDAMDWMFRIAESKGIYDHDRLRGRGAWIDEDRVIFHHGDYLLIDSEKQSPEKIKSHYVYEKRKPFPELSLEKLSKEKIALIGDIVTSFRWENPASAYLLLGWIVLSPICGALRWRPHIWINGGPRSGKTTILEEFINPMLDNVTLYAQGNSTEAGLRQKLSGDALPIIFDESESNTEKDSLRIQNVMSLIRQSSSMSKAQTLKGTSGGQSISYHIQSMFCLSSIQTAIIEQADKERIIILSLLPNNPGVNSIESWRALSNKLDILNNTETLSRQVLTFVTDNIAMILSNVDTFVAAAADKFLLQREGNQYGALLGAAYTLLLERLIMVDEARDIIDLYNFDDSRENSSDNESQRILTRLFSTQIRVNNGQYFLRDIILHVAGQRIDGLSMSSGDLKRLLNNYGMKVKNDSILFCNNHPKLSSLLPNVSDLHSTLQRHPNVTKIDQVERFGEIVSRCLSIPIKGLYYDDE